MTIPLLDVGAAYRELQPAIDEAIARVLGSGHYIGGEETERFEAAYATYCGAGYCVGVGNGLDALSLTLRAMDVGTGDEVIVASNGFIATLLAVSSTGAVPVLVEPDPVTHNLDPAKVEAAVTSRTRVLLPTHLYGQPADLDPLLALARRYELKLVEDSAQAHGASYKGRRVGAHGDAVTWSFYPSKNLGAMGDAGAVTTHDPQLAARIRTLGNYGSSRRYVNEVRGVNSRLDPLQAAVLAVKLDHLEAWNERRRVVAAFYTRELARCDLTLPCVPDWVTPVWHQYVIECDNRDALAARLDSVGIATLVHYPIPPHLQRAYSDLDVPRSALPIAERLAGRVLSLPMGPHLGLDQAARVVAEIRAQ